MSSFPSVPGYTIVRKVAEGGSAEIFKARRQPYNTTCALKVLHARHMDDKRLIRGFETEARLLETFDHKNIIKFHRVIPKSERPAMELELFDSDHLKRIAGKIHRDGSTIPLNEALFILLQVLEALEYLHKKRIVHKDMKPENVLVNEENEVKLIDFSIAAEVKTGFFAKLFHKEPPPEGTPTYLSPEQVTGQIVDERADLYSFGVMAFELFAGRPPLTSTSRAGLVKAHVSEKPPSMKSQAKKLPDDVADIIDKCLKKLPAARPPAARAIIEVFQQYC